MDDANVHAHVVDGFDYADSTEIDEELVTLENQPMWTDTPYSATSERFDTLATSISCGWPDENTKAVFQRLSTVQMWGAPFFSKTNVYNTSAALKCEVHLCPNKDRVCFVQFRTLIN